MAWAVHGLMWRWLVLIWMPCVVGLLEMSWEWLCKSGWDAPVDVCFTCALLVLYLVQRVFGCVGGSFALVVAQLHGTALGVATECLSARVSCIVQGLQTPKN